MAKAKFKIGTLVKHGDPVQFGEVDAIVQTAHHTTYEVGGARLQETEILAAYTPKKTAAPKARTATARPKKTKTVTENVATQ